MTWEGVVVGRKYGGVLGLVSFTPILARGVLRGSDAESTLLTASLCMMALAAVGYVVGNLAAWVVDESVRTKLADKLESQSAAADGAGQTK